MRERVFGFQDVRTALEKALGEPCFFDGVYYRTYKLGDRWVTLSPEKVQIANKNWVQLRVFRTDEIQVITFDEHAKTLWITALVTEPF